MLFDYSPRFYELLIGIGLFIILNFSVSCEHNTEKVKQVGYNVETVPSMVSFGDSILYSDSGRVQIKVIAEQILIFDKAKEPYTFFPAKAYLEQYDSVMTVITKLWADSVWNYNKQKLWKLRGNVKIEKSTGITYESEELFWDELNDKIYSNQYVTIYEPGKGIQRARKFESNQNLTDYTFYQVKDGEYYFLDKSEKTDTEKQHKKAQYK